MSKPTKIDERMGHFLQAAGLAIDTEIDVRRIGTDDRMVNLIIERIATGEKTVTFSLPWLRERLDQPEPVPGLHVVVLDAAGNPALLLRFTRVKNRLFGEMTAADIAHEGLPMRSLDAWRPLHQAVWTEKLAPYGLAVSDDMPVTAEHFELLYQRPGAA
jgi:uncharacterized protein YhfF